MSGPFFDTFNYNITANAGATNTSNYLAGVTIRSPPSNVTIRGAAGGGSTSVNSGSHTITVNSTSATGDSFNFLRYDFLSPANLGEVATISFSSFSGSLPSITITINGNNPITNRPGTIVGSQLVFTINSNLSNVTAITFNSFTLGAINSLLTCVVANTKISTPHGYKLVQDIQRGDEIIGGKVARLIRNEIHPETMIEAIIFPKNCLGENIPQEDLTVCSLHYIFYNGYRRPAKAFLGFPVIFNIDKAKNILSEENGKYYFYDIQYEHEGFYIANGVECQSKSPYCQISPLEKELYFDQSKYSDIRVQNTLCNFPEYNFNYIFPDGRESENIALVNKKK